MGLLEILRQKREEEEIEATRIQGIAGEQCRLKEQNHAAIEAEFNRRETLRNQALFDSAVPDLARKAAILLGHPLEEREDSIRLILSHNERDIDSGGNLRTPQIEETKVLLFTLILLM